MQQYEPGLPVCFNQWVEQERIGSLGDVALPRPIADMDLIGQPEASSPLGNCVGHEILECLRLDFAERWLTKQPLDDVSRRQLMRQRPVIGQHGFRSYRASGSRQLEGGVECSKILDQ